MTRREYTDEDRAAVLTALEANGGNSELVAVETGISRRTIRSWAERYGADRDGSTEREDVTERRSQRQAQIDALRLKTKETLRKSLLDVITLGLKRQVETLGEGSKVSGRDAAIMAGVAFDKVRLLDNEPTSITADTDLATFLASAGYDRVRGQLHVLPEPAGPVDAKTEAS